jgi:hypothetical protein
MATVPVPRTWISGELVVSSFMNGLRDALNFLLSPPCWVLKQNTVGQSVAAGTDTPVAWDTEDIDSDNVHSTVTNTSRVTPQTPGWYQIDTICGVGFISSTKKLSFRLNGTTPEFGATQQNPPGTGAWIGSIATKLFCNGTTDYIEVLIFNLSGTASTENSHGNPRFTGLWVRAA